MIRRVQTDRHDWLQFWEDRELSFLHAMPFVLLVVATALDITSRGWVNKQGLVDLGLAAVTGGWMLAIPIIQRRTDAAAAKAAMFTILIGLSLVLVIRSSLFGFYCFTGYFWVFRLLKGRMCLAGVAMVAVTSAVAQSGGGPYNSASEILVLAVFYAINLGVSGTVIWFAWISRTQKDHRVRAISELTETNARLADSLRENAELQEQLLVKAREAGVSDERRRMAREIHDTLAQGLTGIITQLQAAERAGVPSGPAGGHVEAAIELARESLSEARRSVEALRPEPLEGTRLPDAMREIAARWTALHGVPVSVTTTGNARVMRTEIEVALLRTAQEALANVAKHAAASRVGLTLSYMEDLVTLDVRDDGVGFRALPVPRPSNGNTGGFGLAAMRQRLQGVAGTLQVESEPRAGTAISATVPAISAGGGT